MELTENQKRDATKIFIKTLNEEDLVTYILGQDEAIKGLTKNINSWKEQYLKHYNNE